jgi:hypothetical protein
VRGTLFALALLLAAAALLVRVQDGDPPPAERVVPEAPAAEQADAAAPEPGPYGLAPAPVRLQMPFKDPPPSGLLF